MGNGSLEMALIPDRRNAGRVSLRPLGTVYPAGGSLNTSVKASAERLFELVGERWVDLCTLPPGAAC